MGEKITRAERVRQEQKQQKPKEPVRAKPRETTFEKTMRQSQQPLKMQTQIKSTSKTVTEEAIHQATRHERQGDEKRRRNDDEQDKGRESRDQAQQKEGGAHGPRVVAKGKLKQGAGGGQGGKGQGGFHQGMGRRRLSSALTKSGAKSLPADLQGKFAARFAQTLKGTDVASQTALTQQVLNQLVQYVRIGLNRKGEKEIQIELHERIFRGLKLRVIARDGKVAVHLKATDAAGRKALQENTEAISKALKQKGIEVDEILVT